jgi:hypothetical protein
MKHYDVFSLAENRELRKAAISDEKRKKAKDITELIDYYNLDATKQDIKDWHDAKLLALDYQIPDWTDLIRVYDDVMVDAFLYGIIMTIKDIVKSREFRVLDKSGKEQETELFDHKWFFNFLDWSVESFFYPYSVIFIGDMVNGTFNDMKLIPREYYIPQHNFVKKSLYSYGAYKHKFDGWDITSPELKNYYICVKTNEKLGLLDKVAYHAIGKKNMLIYLWRFAEKYGIPIAIGKTDIRDPARRTNLENMLTNMGSSLWVVADPEDEVQLIETKSPSSNLNLFKDAKDSSNFEISVALAGSESLFKEKSFVGAAEVGERIFEMRQKSILRDIMFTINNELIPRMVWYGLPVEGWHIQWVNEDNVSYSDKISAVQTLQNHFELDPDEVGEKLGFTLKQKKDIMQEKTIDEIKNRDTTSVMPEVDALYKNILAPLPTKKKDERKKDFIKRCMINPVMISEYPDEKTRHEAILIQYEK